ncbi:uncharacterized protein BKCO1_2900080 [Diplodia corticola]|uniref:Essential protein Yae1 N-terminal domain-containing protein n=1 Tax=Diplodia corticola TaxID=236234 RepID=A0A1J9QYW1_9PEZI|nr:uncharacterized protein BKCO1_2900080 [Diplodia corticola]OJD33569.1 hypothetical protein BKCO1_2900080 [Diplodia corticola]
MDGPTLDLDLDLDPFDSLLSLEDQYYTEGHALGVADGSRAGRIEGRVFGLEKGFEKFAAMGHLHGKAAVWASRLPPPPPPKNNNNNSETPQHAPPKHDDPTTTTAPSLPPLQAGSNTNTTNPRLAKHITTLHALTEPASLSTQNDEEGVADFDDRLKRAQAKAKIVEKLVGEGQEVGELQSGAGDVAAAAAVAADGGGGGAGASTAAGAEVALRAKAKGPRRIGVKMVQKRKDGGRGEERSMEDFGAPVKDGRS